MANPLIVGALLFASAGTLYWLGKQAVPRKKKQASTAKPTPASKGYFFGDACQVLDRERMSDEEADQFVLDQLEAFGGLTQLGDPPGNVEANIAFAQGFVRHVFGQTVSPVCVERITQVGATMPPGLAEFFTEDLSWGVDDFMMERGYDLGTGAELEGAVGGSGRPSLIDVIRGV